MKGFAENLAIFLRSEASSAVQSQLAEHGKLEPSPCIVICTALVPQKIWVVCQTAGNWHPFSVSGPGNHCVYCPVLRQDEADDRNRNQRAYIWCQTGGGTKANENSQNTVAEETA